jgi:hypothetical protein
MACRLCGEAPFHSPDCLLLEPQQQHPIIHCTGCGILLVGAAYLRANDGCGFCDSCLARPSDENIERQFDLGFRDGASVGRRK